MAQQLTALIRQVREELGLTEVFTPPPSPMKTEPADSRKAFFVSSMRDAYKTLQRMPVPCRVENSRTVLGGVTSGGDIRPYLQISFVFSEKFRIRVSLSTSIWAGGNYDPYPTEEIMTVSGEEFQSGKRVFGPLTYEHASSTMGDTDLTAKEVQDFFGRVVKWVKSCPAW